MNDVKLNMPSGAASVRLLKQQVILVAVFSVLALLAIQFPLEKATIPYQHYLPLHTLLEFIAILAAFLVFATVWHTPAKEVSASLLLIAIGLFSAGWLDFAHALSFKGMPDLITRSSVEKGIAFWLAARLLVATTLLGVSFYPELQPPSIRGRYGMLSLFATFNLLVIWVVIFHEAELPVTYLEGVGLTPLKGRLEWFITALLAFSGWRYYQLARRSEDDFLPLIFGAASLAALSELFFVHYEVVSDVQNLLGHLYKFVSYSLMYRAMFVVSVRKPYQKLTHQTEVLMNANETLRTQALVLESTATPVQVTDTRGLVKWRNRASRMVFPLESTEAESKLSLFSAPVTPDPIVADDIRATVQNGAIWRGQVHLEIEPGKHIIMDRTVTPLRNESGVIEGYVSVSEDVTESVQAQSRHKRVLDTALDGFLIADTKGHLLEVNGAYARMSGYTVDELLSMNISQLEVIEQKADVEVHLARVIHQGSDKFETRHRHKQGHEFVVEISATYDPESEELFVFTRDRSEREQSVAVQQDLERQLQQSQKTQALGQLTGGIAHDFNNILVAILGYTNLALTRCVDDKESKLATYLREVISASERARDLIAKMLSFARTQPSASISVISPAVVVDEVVAMMRPSIPSSIQIRSRIDDDPHIRMDPGELNQVLVNLIINARDAIEGHGTIDIWVHTVEVKGLIGATSHQRLSGIFLAIDVSDSGSGISPENKSRLFDPFFTTKDVGKGTGLGLSMVQGILRRSGGHVVVESQLGRGSRFQLLFPLVSPPEIASTAPTDQLEGPSGSGQRIWVLDDERVVAQYFGDLLGDIGYKVRLFNEPAQVLMAFRAKENSVDLLLTDQTMPDLSGVALAKQLHCQRPDLPIILCTGHSEVIDRSELQKHGIRRVFSKPVNANELLKAVAEELEPKKTLKVQ